MTMEKRSSNFLVQRMFSAVQNMIARFNKQKNLQREEILKLYSRVVNSPEVSTKDAFLASKLQIVFASTCRENILFLSALFIFIFFTGTFMNEGHAFTFEGALIAIVIIIACGLVYGALGFFLQPLQIMYGISGLFLVAISSIITASVMATITPEIWELISQDQFVNLEWFNLFIGFLEICLLSGVLVYSYNTDVFSFRRFQKMVAQKSDDFGLPPEVRGRILLLRAQDHYVDVTTDKGKHMLRMKFSEALDRVSELEGIQTHRSCWIAKEQIAQVRTSGTQTIATLKSGEEIPVSASRLLAVKRWAEIWE